MGPAGRHAPHHTPAAASQQRLPGQPGKRADICPDTVTASRLKGVSMVRDLQGTMANGREELFPTARTKSPGEGQHRCGV